MMVRFIGPAVCLALLPSPALAGELFGGLYVHDVKTPLNLSGVEDGADLQLGYRGGKIGRTPIQPYGLVSVHTAGKTSFVAAGVSAQFGSKFYVRPGFGLAIHTGSAAEYDNPANDDIEFGSRVLFEPELGVGYRINGRTSVEASWVHISQGQIFGKQNPGMDSVGVRMNLKL